MCEIYAHHPRIEIKHDLKKKKRMKTDFRREKQPGTNKLLLSFKSWTGNFLQVKIYSSKPSPASLPLDIFTLAGHLSFIWWTSLCESTSQLIAEWCINFLLQKARAILTLHQVLVLFVFSGSICKWNTTLSTKEQPHEKELLLTHDGNMNCPRPSKSPELMYLELATKPQTIPEAWFTSKWKTMR